jgi:hypothetical protein
MPPRGIDLSPFDIQFIQACILGVVRRAQQQMPERDAIRFTTAMAETVSRLNTASINEQDVDVICLSIKKTVDLLQTDRGMPMRARELTRMKGHEIQEKFTRALHGSLPHIWNDGERQDDASETPSSAIQVQ